jgi:hypothetical protein
VAFALELAPQVADEDVGDVRVDVEVVTPHQLEQPLPGQHHTGILRQHGEQVEFPLRQLSPIALDEHEAPGRVDGQRPDGHRVRRPIRQAGTAQQRVQPGDQLTEVERLGQVVVRARFEPGDAVVDRVASGQHADRDVVAQRPQRGHHRDAVQLWHLHVQNQRIMAFGGQQSQRFLAGRRYPHVETRVPQSTGHRSSDVRIVVDHQNRATRAVKRGWFCHPHGVKEWPGQAERRSDPSDRRGAGECRSGQPSHRGFDPCSRQPSCELDRAAGPRG